MKQHLTLLVSFVSLLPALANAQLVRAEFPGIDALTYVVEHTEAEQGSLHFSFHAPGQPLFLARPPALVAVGFGSDVAPDLNLFRAAYENSGLTAGEIGRLLGVSRYVVNASLTARPRPLPRGAWG